MPSEMSKFKKYLQFLSFEQQISKINLAINKMLCLNNMLDVKEELKTLRNQIIKDKKEIITFLSILYILINYLSLNSGE